mmetsp:Transcript_15500/g.32778  ORF Transcript_15500/g.32778 Transcript_15500/m.32778 type:complete len:1275 (-) Transcript_15500:129-3953(-)
MWSLPGSKFTFDDNSTLTSFTDLRQHHKRKKVELFYVGDDGDDNTDETDGGTYDNDEEGEDKENQSRRGLDCKSTFSSDPFSRVSGGSKSIQTSNNTLSSPQSIIISSPTSSNQFWTKLSVHAASSAITIGASTNDPKMAHAAADAAVNSLMEDCREMERINFLRAQQQKDHPNAIKTKPLMRITHQTIRNAASKASIAVLQSGATPEVAAAVASAILREGGNIVDGNKSSKSSVQSSASKTSQKSKEMSSSMSTILSSSSKRHAIPCKTNMKNSTSNNNIHGSPGDRSILSSPSSSSSTILSSTSKKPHAMMRKSNKNNSNSINASQSLLSPTGSISSFQPSNSRRSNKSHHPSDATIQSISSSKFGIDKYATGIEYPSNSSNVMKGMSISLDKSSKGAATKKNNNDIYMNEEAMNAVKAALAMMKKKKQENQNNMNAAAFSYMNDEAMNAVREAMDMMEKKKKESCQGAAPHADDRQSIDDPNLSIYSGETRDDSATTGSAMYQDFQRILPDPSGVLLSLEDPSGEFLASGSSSVIMPNAVPANPSPIDKVQQQQSQRQQPSYDDSSSRKDHPSLEIAQQQQQRRQLEEKQADYYAALEVLQQKLNELESCDGNSHNIGSDSQSTSGNSLRERQPLAPGKYQQLQTPSMVQNPSYVSGIHKTTSSMNTPTITNYTNTLNNNKSAAAGSIVSAQSSTNTHYPPMSPMNTLPSVDTGHHGYDCDITVAKSVTSSSTGSGTGNGSVISESSTAAVIRAPLFNSPPHSRRKEKGSAPSLTPSSASGSMMGLNSNAGSSISTSTTTTSHYDANNHTGIRSVLKKPSKCFPIIEVGNEMVDPTWDEDGAVFMPLGEFRIHTNDGAVKEDNEEETETDKKEEAIEVVLVADSNPQSPTSRLKSRFKEFFRRKSKRVTFDMNRVDEYDAPLRGIQQQHDREQEEEQRQPQPPSANTNTAVDPNAVRVADSAATVASTKTTSSRSTMMNTISSTGTKRRRKSLREKFLKKLRRGRIFRSLSSSKKHSGGADNAASITVVESVAPQASLAGAMGRTMAEESAPMVSKAQYAQGLSENTDNVKTDSKKVDIVHQTQETAPAESTDMQTKPKPELNTRSSSYDTTLAHRSSRSVRSDTDTLSTFPGDDVSKHTASVNEMTDSESKHTTSVNEATDNEDSSSSESNSNSASSNNTFSSSSEGEKGLISSTFNPYGQHSIYIGDVLDSIPTYGSGASVSEESWVETVLHRFTNGELKGMFPAGNETSTENSSAKSKASSLAKYNFV